MEEHNARILDHATLLKVIEHTPLVAIDLIVRNARGEVLVGWRTNRPAKDCWFVPGGRICKDERRAAAYARISYGELGTALPLAEATFRGAYEHHYDENFADRPGISTHYIVLAYEIRLETALADLPQAQHSRYRWLSVTDLLEASDVHPNTKAYFSA